MQLETKGSKSLAMALTKENAASAAKLVLSSKLMLIIGALVGVTYLIVKAVKAYNDALDQEEKAAEKAAKAAEQLAEASEHARQEVDELKSAFDNYQSAIDTLNSLKEGMEGYEAAVRRVKEETIELLNLYPELASAAGLYNKDGSLNEEVVNAYITKKEQEAYLLELASTSAKGAASRAKYNAEAAKYAKEFNQSESIIHDDANVGKVSFDSLGIGQEIFNNIDKYGGSTKQQYLKDVEEYLKTLTMPIFDPNQQINSFETVRAAVQNAVDKGQNREASVNLAEVYLQGLFDSSYNEDDIREKVSEFINSLFPSEI